MNRLRHYALAKMALECEGQVNAFQMDAEPKLGFDTGTSLGL